MHNNNNNNNNNTEVFTIIKALTDIAHTPLSSRTLEQQLLAPRLLRKLYRLVPLPDTAPEPYPHLHYTRNRYYTKTDPALLLITPDQIHEYNHLPIDSHVRNCSNTKLEIIGKYLPHHWYLRVYPYIVMASRIVPHPTIPNIAIRYQASRDTNTYELLLMEEENN